LGDRIHEEAILNGRGPYFILDIMFSLALKWAECKVHEKSPAPSGRPKAPTFEWRKTPGGGTRMLLIAPWAARKKDRSARGCQHRRTVISDTVESAPNTHGKLLERKRLGDQLDPCIQAALMNDCVRE
jgi:hypothetical protein